MHRNTVHVYGKYVNNLMAFFKITANAQHQLQYEESKSKQRKTRTLPAADFLFLVLKHVLPKRFRRSRDYGFHHGNAGKTLVQIQLLLHHAPPVMPEPVPWRCLCPSCGREMRTVFIDRTNKLLSSDVFRNRGSPEKEVQS